MNSNILIDLLPSKVEIEGISYDIRTDFRISILFTMLIEDDSLTEVEKMEQILLLYYPKIPTNQEEAFNKIMWFYRGGKDEAKGENSSSKNNKNNDIKVFDYEEDSELIYSAFLSQYRIDLQDIKNLHWWKFKALLTGLKDDNKLHEVIKYRSIDLNKIHDKEERKFYKEMKEKYSLEKISKEEIQEIKKWNDFLKQL